MKKTNLKHIILFATAAAVLTGCSAAAPASSSAPSTAEPAPASSSGFLANGAAGAVLLSVNPEIEVEYDKNGVVLEVEGINDDGKSVVSGYTGFEGKDCQTVVSELVREIYEDGYFENTVAGRAKNVVVKLEEGSSYPDQQFLDDVANGVRSAVESCGVDSVPVPVSDEDYAQNGYIGLEKAKEIVLAQLGLSEATFTERDYELDDGVYELEFTSGGVEYEFEVDAVTGKVLEADYDRNDDWGHYDDDHDDLDDRYDDMDDRYDDDYDDADDRYDDVDDHYDDVDDRYDDMDDRYDDADDRYDDMDDRYDDVDDRYDDMDDRYDDDHDDDADDLYDDDDDDDDDHDD